MSHQAPFERALSRLLLAAYERRLRSVVAVAAAGGAEERLRATERIGYRWVGAWVSDVRGHCSILVDHLAE